MKTLILKMIHLPLSRKKQFITNIYYKIKTKIFYSLFFKSIGKNTLIQSPLFLTPEFISVGSDVYIWEGIRLEGIHKYLNQDFSPHIIVEDGVTIQQNCHITAAETLRISKNTMISFGVSIQDTDHEYQSLDLPPVHQQLKVNQTFIGENCFIGSGAKIQAGTILGKHCIIGTNAVVRGIFPDYCVIVGIPAKIIKRYDHTSETWKKTDSQGNILE